MSLQFIAKSQHYLPVTAPSLKQGGGFEFSVITAFETGRSAAERYIADKFKCAHDAHISEFMPELLVMTSDADDNHSTPSIAAALGIRHGSSEGRLFLENYLDIPVEQLLSGVLVETVQRRDIVEIGNLVATRKGSSLLLFVALTRLLDMQAVQWAIFTATPEVRKLLQRLQLPQHFLAEADPARLGAARENWGSYYDSRPAVIAVRIETAIAALNAQAWSSDVLHSVELPLRQLLQVGA